MSKRAALLLLLLSWSGCPERRPPPAPPPDLASASAAAPRPTAPPAAPRAAHFEVPCDQVLALGLVRFSEEYGRSEVGEDRAAEYFAECVQKRGQPQRDALPPAQAKAVAALDAALADLLPSYHQVVSFGGTMAIHAGRRSVATRALLQERVVAALQRPAPPSAEQAAQRARLTSEVARLRKLATEAKPPEGAEPAPFAQAVTTLTEALTRLEAALKDAPPQVIAPLSEALRGYNDRER